MVRVDLFLSGLTACIALIGYLPLLAHLGLFARVFFPAALLAGGYLYYSGRSLPGRVLTPLSILLFLYLASGFSVDRLVPVTADLLVVFLGVRLLGERSGRHYLQAFALSLFCLAASSLFEMSALFLVYLFALLLLLAVALVLLTFHAQDEAILLTRHEARKVVTVALLMPVAALPLLLFFFFILPRTQYPLWNFLQTPAEKRIGFSDTVKPGSAPAVSAVKGVVLRAVSPKVPEQKLYWRGVVLNSFKDDAWVRKPVPGEVDSVPAGERVTQEIYPERTQSAYLPALNIGRAVSGLRNEASTDGVFVARRPLDQKVKYLAESALSDVIQVRGLNRTFYLELPGNISHRMVAKGREVAQKGGSSAQRMQLLEHFFRGQRLTYANSGMAVGADPLDSFLFDKKRGNCEYFASSYAILLRLAGIPSRLVGGYRGGIYNDIGGYYLVTEDMAHVWVEAYEDGVGWRFVDPSAWALGAVRGAQATGFAKYLDMAGFFWDKAVVTYDLEKQITLVREAGSRARNLRLPEKSGKGLLVVMLAVVPLVLVALWIRRRPPSVEARLLRRMLRVTARRHQEDIVEGEGLFELAARLDDPHLKRFVSIYGAAVYRDRSLSREEVAQLEEIIRLASQHLP